jgi:hypothetical protein
VSEEKNGILYTGFNLDFSRNEVEKKQIPVDYSHATSSGSPTA